MSLRTIEASLFAQLETLLTTASPGGYVVAVARVAGDRESQAKLEAASMVGDNLVALVQDRSAPADAIHNSRGASQQTLIAARWRVRVLVRNTASIDAALSDANSGVYALQDAVIGALIGFKAAGLQRNERVRFVGTETLLHKPGRFIATVIVETRYAIQAPEPVTTTEEPLLIHGDVNLIPAADTAPNPLTEVEAEP